MGVGLVESRLGGFPVSQPAYDGASKPGIMFVKRVSSSAHFAPYKMGKSTVVRGDFLFVGLNAFDPGQEHAWHVHEGQDKLYFILEGTAVVHIEEQSETLSAGDAAYAPRQAASIDPQFRAGASGSDGGSGAAAKVRT